MVTTPWFGVPCNHEEPCPMLGALASVAGGDQNHAEWVWLTGRRAEQSGWTPLHAAASICNVKDAAIKALLAANADVHAKEGTVRVGARGVVLGGRGGCGVGTVLYYCGLDF